jgi:hypothetical protein
LQIYLDGAAVFSVLGLHMKNAEEWLLADLKKLNFSPYQTLLPKISALFGEIDKIDREFKGNFRGQLTKRQIVVYGLMARVFQLSIGCLSAQLLQNRASWVASYRSLLEAFFVIEWINYKVSRADSYFTGNDPGIGKIKAEVCTRIPVFKKIYEDTSSDVHLGTTAFYLGRNNPFESGEEFPFISTDMSISGSNLVNQLNLFIEAFGSAVTFLRSLLVDLSAELETSELFWDDGLVKKNFGCLAYQPKVQREGEDTQEMAS